METNIYHSDLAIHPGKYLEEILEDIGMSQSELSERLGRPSQAINEIIKGKKSITPTTALELEDVLKVPSHIWLGLESEYQITIAKQAEQKQMGEEISLIERFPYTELVKLGFVKKTRNLLEKVDELKQFFSVAKLSQIANVKMYQPAFRIATNHDHVLNESIAAWMQASKIRATKIVTKAFDKEKLENELAKIKAKMVLDDINESLFEIRDILASCGIAFILLPHFKNTKMHGATFWIEDGKKAIVAMTLRGSYSDVFWFSFFHELGHILLHSKREVFLEDGCDNKALQQQENEANEFSKNFLIPSNEYNNFIAQENFTKTAITKFAKRLNIKPSIIVGRLMHDELIAFGDFKLNSLRDKYNWAK